MQHHILLDYEAKSLCNDRKVTAVSEDFISIKIAGYSSLHGERLECRREFAITVASMALRFTVLLEESPGSGSGKSQEFLLHSLKYWYFNSLRP